ncbi:uncharacterized protein TNCV_663511 [Trichonephila clavipes]|nr:uncharacterized protein TNCV_663511 [Trichonephila clavipes]
MRKKKVPESLEELPSGLFPPERQIQITIDMQSLAEFNKGYKYLLTCIDLFSKFAWAVPLKDKFGKSVKSGLEIIFKERKPKVLQTDAGHFYAGVENIKSLNFCFQFVRSILLNGCSSSNVGFSEATLLPLKKVIESVEEGERKVDVAKAFEIPLSSLSTILKNKEKIFSASSSRVRKRVSKGNFPRLEQCLVSWMRQCRGQNIPMGGSLLKEKAKAFAKELGIEFSASEGWLTNFKKRNGIVFKKCAGKAQVSTLTFLFCSKWQNSLSDLIKEY